jgi:hypothetical protein
MPGNPMDSSMFDFNTSIHMDRIVPSHYDEDPRTLGGITSPCYPPRLRQSISSTFAYPTHRSTLVCVCGYVFSIDVDPQCTA